MHHLNKFRGCRISVHTNCHHVLLGTARGQYKNQVNNMHIKIIWAPPYFYGKYGNRCTYEQNIQRVNELVGNGISVTTVSYTHLTLPTILRV